MKIGVVGLGLIGGSIFKKLNELNYEVIGISRSVKENNVTNDYNTLKDCDLVFVCTPMNITLEILDKLNSILDSKTLVTDVCSLKDFVSHKKYNFRFLPSHPMAGTENNGWESSFPELFKGAKWAITPIDNEINDDIDILEKVINDMGAETVITTAEEHDKAVALISHAPMVIAQALCDSIKNNKLAQILASSGFRDTTRLALSNVEMANDMVNMNKNNIDYAFKELQKSFDNITSGNYKEKAQELKHFRQDLFS